MRPALRIIALAVALNGCVRPPQTDAPAIHLDTREPGQATVEVSGLSRSALSALASAHLSEDEWSALLRVAVRPPVGQPAAPAAVAGRYSLGTTIRFVPAFPLDAGRSYDVSLDTARVSRVQLPPIAAQSTVALPGVIQAPATIVSAVYPSGASVPANQLRMYLQFSAPMGQQGGRGHIVLLDRAGQEIPDALLPLDTELWNSERTRYTVLFDPGRVKREILPNRQMGRALRQGETITLVVKADWPDAHGVPLKEEFRHEYDVTPPDESPLQPQAWGVTPPAAGTRDPLILDFPEPLDHALLQRALTIAAAGAPVSGAAAVERFETRWTFVPREPWQAGAHTIVILPILEDLAGNRIGRAFEVRSPGEAVAPEEARPLSLPFRVSARPGR